MVSYCIPTLGYSLILSLGSATFGYTIAYPSPTIPGMKKDFGEGVISDVQYTMFNAVTAVAAILGPFLVKLLVSPQYPFGRRATSFILACSGAGFWLLFLGVSADRFWLGILARALCGVTMGAFSALSPMYIVELSPRESTAFFGAIHQFMVAFGIDMCYLIGTWISWEANAIVGAGLMTAMSLLIWIVPESPAYQETSITTLDTVARDEETVFSRQWFLPTMVGCCFFFFQQFTGINAILTNLNELFSAAGISLDSGYASAIAGFAQVVACFSAGPVVEKFGRKAVWILAFGGVTITDFLYALYWIPQLKEKNVFPNWFPIVVIFLNLLLFGIGAGPLPWFLVPERFPSSIRATAVSMATAFNWVFAFVVIFLFPVMQDGIGDSGAFIVFAVISLGATIFGIFNVKEPSVTPEKVHTDIYNDLVTT
jgi:MFS family permease